jgi:hypothetical protein
MRRLASIVIPAHNEEHRIRGLLETLAQASASAPYDIYVVCNGCIDRTRQVAEEYSGVVVVEIDATGKHFALNEGDRLAGDVFPRLYCDADITTTPESIRALVDALDTDEVKVAGPVVHYSVAQSTWAVKMYYRALESNSFSQWHRDHLMGRGLYGASRAARQRFQHFPAMIADDLFFDSQFTPEEKVVVSSCVATIWVPHGLAQLLRGEIRVAEGNMQYQATYAVDAGVSGTAPRQSRIRPIKRLRRMRKWSRDLRGPDLLPLLFYFAVTIAAKTVLALNKSRGRKILWR